MAEPSTALWSPPPATTGELVPPVERVALDLPGMLDRLGNSPFRCTGLAETAIARCEAVPPALADELRRVGAIAPRTELKAFVRMLVSAWPNASQNNDLAGYSAQLAQDVERVRPSRYALEVGARQLRRTSRFLPSISEVLDALEEADHRIIRATRALAQLPARLAEAKQALAWELDRARKETEEDERRRADWLAGKTS
jgi:hypothetical protein